MYTIFFLFVLAVLALVALTRANQALKEVAELRRREERWLSRQRGLKPQAAPRPPDSAPVALSANDEPGVSAQISDPRIKGSPPPILADFVPEGVEAVQRIHEDSSAAPSQEIQPAESGSVRTPLGELAGKLAAPFSENKESQESDATRPARRRGISLEERLGAKLPVWIGAIAIMLAGVFLMAFAVKQGWLTPRLRVYSASVLSIVLIIAGCGLRRSYANLAQGMASAAVGIQFAVLLAVSTLLHQDFAFVTPLFSLLAMVGITALAVVLSLYLGPMVAMIGLIGGFATPALLRLDTQHTTPLFICLVAQQIGISLVGRRSQQTVLAILALIAVQVYAAIWIFWFWSPNQATLLGGVLLAAVACFCLAFPPSEDSPTHTLESRWSSNAFTLADPWWAALPALVLSAVLFSRGEWSWTNLALHSTLLVGVMVFSRLREPFFGLFPCAAGVSIASLIVRLGLMGSPAEREADVLSMWGTGTLALVIGFGSVAAMQGSRVAKNWSQVASWSLAALAVLPHLAVSNLTTSPIWLWIASGVAVVAAVAAVITNYRRSQLADGDSATLSFLTAFSITALLAVALGIRFGDLSLYWFAVGCGAVLFAVAGLTFRWRLYATGSLLAMLAAFLAISLLNPMTLSEKLGPELYWNFATLGFGSAIFALVAAASVLEGCRGKLTAAPHDRILSQSFYALAAVLTAGLCCVLVRHGFSRQGPPNATRLWLEVSTDIVAVSLIGLSLSAIARMTAERWLERLADYFVLIALGSTVVVTGWALGPLMQPVDVGQTPLANWLAFSYGLPIAVGVVALILHRERRSFTGNLVTAVLCLAGVIYLFMSVRHGFWAGSGSLVLSGPGRVHVCEVPTYALILGVIGAVAEWFYRRSESPPMWQAAIVLAAGFGLLAMLVVTAFNPLLWAREIGAQPIFNWLLFIFGAPLGTALLLNQRFRETARPIGLAAGVVAMFMLWLLVTAQVRQYFVGPILPGSPPTQDEWYAYSAAWIVVAILLLVAGVIRRSQLLRWSSLVLMLASVAKVFLFDTRQLGDLWRVASYLGLGVSLMLVAFVYQRFVFRESRGVPGDLP